MSHVFIEREEWCRRNLGSVEIRSSFVLGPGGAEGIWEDDGVPDPDQYLPRPPVRHKLKEFVATIVLLVAGLLFSAISLGTLFGGWPTLQTVGASLVWAMLAGFCARYGLPMGETLQVIEYQDRRDIVT